MATTIITNYAKRRLSFKMKQSLKYFFQFKYSQRKVYLGIFYAYFFILSGYGLMNSSLHWLWLSLIGFIIFRNIGFEIAGHRYLCHESFEAKNNIAKYVMAICSAFGFYGSNLFWSPGHAFHHDTADTIKDPHSPHFYKIQGKTWLDVLVPQTQDPDWSIPLKYYSKLTKKAEVMFVHNYYWLIVLPPFVLLHFIEWRICAFLWALPLLLAAPSVFIINWTTHLKGYRNFDTDDKSYNNTLINFLSLGGGLHNNHHYDPSAYNTKMSDKWYETDFLNVFIIEKFLKK